MTSLIGRSMVPVVLPFAVLGAGGSASDVGLVLGAQTMPLVLFVLAGGAIGDRLPRKVVMLTADLVRCASQGLLAVLLLTGRPALWQFLALAAMLGLGQAFFLPSLTGLIPQITSAERLQAANALRSTGQSSARMAGPALGGLIVAATSPGWAIAADAAAYGVSAACLARLPVPAATRAQRSSFAIELRQGWTEFRSHRWLWMIAAHFAFWNMLVMAPFMALGPVVAESALGGAAAWGTILAALGVGSVCGGLVMLYVRPARPLRIATVATFGLGLPLALIALRAPFGAIVAGALVAGVGYAVFDTLWDTTVQQRIPPEALSRITSYVAFGAVVFLPVGYALAGPLSVLLGVTGALWLGVAWLVVSGSAVLAVPGVTQLRFRHTSGEA